MEGLGEGEGEREPEAEAETQAEAEAEAHIQVQPEQPEQEPEPDVNEAIEENAKGTQIASRCVAKVQESVCSARTCSELSDSLELCHSSSNADRRNTAGPPPSP